MGLWEGALMADCILPPPPPLPSGAPQMRRPHLPPGTPQVSMHNTPLTLIEEAGLAAHRLPVGKASQLSDAFRHGVAWANKPMDHHPLIIDPDYARIYTIARVISWSHGYSCCAQGS